MIAVRSAVLALCLVVAACYSPPQPDCGFFCGPLDECPEGYTCAADKRCHRNGAPASLTCPPDAAIDAPTPIDAPTDVTPPTVMSTMPASGETGVARDATITITFSEPVVGVDLTSFTVASAATPIAGTITTVSPTTYTFTPGANLPASSTIDVALSNGIRDESGNALVMVTFSFETGVN